MTRLSSLLAVLLSACAAQSFQPQFKPRELPTEAAVMQQVTTAKPRDERPVAIGVSAGSTRLFAWDLSAGLLWERAVRAQSAPLVVGDAIVMREARGITVRNLATGEVRAVVDEEASLIGADGEGSTTVVTMAYQGSGDARYAVALVQGNGVRWKQSLQMPAGVPALVGNRVIVPWATQRLSVLSTKDGAELVRWHLNNTVLGLARVDRGRVYVGQLGLMRLDAELVKPEAKPLVYAPFKRSLPGQPPLLRDGYEAVPEPESAHHRLRLEWRIGTGDSPTSSENDLLALRFYRMLFAFDANSDALRWVRTFDHDLVGAVIEPGGMFVADSSGVLRFIDASGATRMQRDLGRPLQVVTIRPGGWVPAQAAASQAAPAPGSSAEATAAAAATPPAPLETPPASLQEQLFAAAALDDDRLGAGRAYAAERLAAMPDESVTAHLVQLCADTKSPQPVQLTACRDLANRQNGGEQIVLALQRRASFLEGTGAPPVGALAQAAAQMKLKQAAPLLLSHMEDPNTPVRDLVAVVETLEQLGHKPAVSAIERFVRLHHAEPDGSDVTPALYASLHALGTLRAKSAKGSLDEMSRDPLAPPPLREKAREAIAMIDAPPVAPSKPEPAKPEPEPEPADEVQADPRPYSLAAEIVRGVLKPVRGQLVKCLDADAAKPRIARISMVVSGGGEVEGVFVTPTTLQACMESALRQARFPQTKAGRQRITHVVNAAGPAKAEPSATTKPEKAKPGKPAKVAAPAKPAPGAKPAAPAKPVQPAKPSAPAPRR